MRKNNNSYFNTVVRANRKRLEWVKRNKDTKTMAGFIDKLLGQLEKKSRQEIKKQKAKEVYGI